MSLKSFQQVAATIKHRDTDSDDESGTGELTTVGYEAVGTQVYCHFQPGPPASQLQAWGMSLDVEAVIYVPADTDIRPDVAEVNGLADKVTIRSKDYIVTDVVNIALRGKYLLVGLRRSS